VTSNESSRSASSNNSGGTENVDDSPAKRRKKEGSQYAIKKVLDKFSELLGFKSSTLGKGEECCVSGKYKTSG
jgi:hypothetical protein